MDDCVWILDMHEQAFACVCPVCVCLLSIQKIRLKHKTCSVHIPNILKGDSLGMYNTGL